MDALSSLPLATLQSYMTEALTAQHALMTGARVVEVRNGNGQSGKYSEADASKLSDYINRLNNAISAKQGLRGFGPIYPVSR